MIREKGTNRSQFFRGETDKYTWRDLGSSFLMSELQAAYLYAQLEAAQQIKQVRLAIWQRYFEVLRPFAEQGRVSLPTCPPECEQNGHLFYLKWQDMSERNAFIDWLKQHGILAVFHYVPLHSSPAGRQYGRFVGKDRFTTSESERLVRLPLSYNLQPQELDRIIHVILEFFTQ